MLNFCSEQLQAKLTAALRRRLEVTVEDFTDTDQHTC